MTICLDIKFKRCAAASWSEITTTPSVRSITFTVFFRVGTANRSCYGGPLPILRFVINILLLVSCISSTIQTHPSFFYFVSDNRWNIVEKFPLILYLKRQHLLKPLRFIYSYHQDAFQVQNCCRTDRRHPTNINPQHVRITEYFKHSRCSNFVP